MLHGSGLKTLRKIEVAADPLPKSTQIQLSVIRIFTQAGQSIANTTPIQEKGFCAMKNTEVWIGRFDVKPLPGNDSLGAAKGAIVNVVALAADKGGYVRLVEQTMNEYDFEVIRYDDVERLDEWIKENRLNPDLEQFARGLTREYPVQFDEFQSYSSDNA